MHERSLRFESIIPQQIFRNVSFGDFWSCRANQKYFHHFIKIEVVHFIKQGMADMMASRDLKMIMEGVVESRDEG